MFVRLNATSGQLVGTMKEMLGPCTAVHSMLYISGSTLYGMMSCPPNSVVVTYDINYDLFKFYKTAGNTIIYDFVNEPVSGR